MKEKRKNNAEKTFSFGRRFLFISLLCFSEVFCFGANDVNLCFAGVWIFSDCDFQYAFPLLFDLIMQDRKTKIKAFSVSCKHGWVSCSRGNCRRAHRLRSNPAFLHYRQLLKMDLAVLHCLITRKSAIGKQLRVGVAHFCKEK